MKSKTLILFLIVLCLLVLVSSGTVVYQSFKTGFSAKGDPHPFEIFVARQVRRLAIPLEQRKKPNPISATSEVLADARAHFADHCATCHANDGSGKTSIG